jgi:hypothetical protein
MDIVEVGSFGIRRFSSIDQPMVYGIRNWKYPGTRKMAGNLDGQANEP